MPQPRDPFADGLPTLATPRLRLRPFAERDGPALLDVFGDAETMRYWNGPPMPDRAAAEAYLAQVEAGFRDRSVFHWAVARRDDPAGEGGDRLVGTCTLAGWDRARRQVELGYALGRAHRGQGLAREAVAAVVRFAFVRLDVRRVEADVDAANAASIRLLERLGFARDQPRPDPWRRGGDPAPPLLFRLLRTDTALATLDALARTAPAPSAP